MKYIILPICRLIYVLIFCCIGVPLMFFVCVFISLWNFNLSGFKIFNKELGEKCFYKEDTDFMFNGDKFFYYKTAWDYLLNRKSWDTIKERK